MSAQIYSFPEPSSKLKIKTTMTGHATKTIQLNSLADLDRIVSEQFDLPARPYSTDINAALQLVADVLENFECPHFEISHRESNAFPGLPFAVSFNQERWTYGKTAPLAICHDALHKFKGVAVTIPGSYYWNLD
ncbi:hypothetical protein [Scytonema hofmannii]